MGEPTGTDVRTACSHRRSGFVPLHDSVGGGGTRVEVLMAFLDEILIVSSSEVFPTSTMLPDRPNHLDSAIMVVTGSVSRVIRVAVDPDLFLSEF